MILALNCELCRTASYHAPEHSEMNGLYPHFTEENFGVQRSQRHMLKPEGAEVSTEPLL